MEERHWTEKHFIPAKQALDLRELGFDEPCMAFFILFLDGTLEFNPWKMETHGKNITLAPTWRQAFTFFREKYKVEYYPMLHEKDAYWCLMSNSGFLMEDDEYGYYSEKHLEFKTFEEAELECLKELIKFAQEFLNSKNM